jgi:hypothetical protein
MKYFIYIFLLAASFCHAMAEDLSNPTNLYLEALFQDPEIKSDFRNYWTGSPDGTSAREDPNGGYLFRFDFRFEEGNDVLAFVATDRFGVGRESPPWAIYQKTPAGQWREIGKNEIFQSGGISLHHSSRTIIQVFPPDRHDPEERKTYVTLKINEDGSVHKESYRSDQLNVEAREMIEKEAVPIVPEIEKIPLAAYLLSPQAEWRPLSEHGMAAQSLDPADAPLLASSKDLEWSQAVDLAKTLTDNPSNPSEDQTGAHQSEQANPPFIPQQSAPRKPTDQKPATSAPVGESPPPPRWPLVAAVIAAALGLLWLLLKKRK